MFKKREKKTTTFHKDDEDGESSIVNKNEYLTKKRHINTFTV